MAKSREYKLKEPFQFGKEYVESVTITEKLSFLRGHSMRAGVGEGREVTVHFEFSTIIDLAAKMITQVPGFLDHLGDEDRAEIMGEAQRFLFSSLGTGLTA